MKKLNIERGRGENWEIEKWRKRYFFQAILVVLLGGGSVCLSLFFIKGVVFLSFLILLIILIMYLMISELYLDMQNRAQNVIIIKNKGRFGDVSFVYDEGVNLEVIEKMGMISGVVDVVGGNGLKSEKWGIFEEDILGYFYNELKMGRKSIFEGFLIALNTNSFDGKGKIRLDKGKIVFSFDTNKTYDNEEFKIFMLRIMKFFNVSNAWCKVYDEKLYIGLLTKAKLFSDFSLIKKNSTDNFVSRVNNIIDIMNKF